MLSEFFVNFTLQGTQQRPEPQFLNRMLKQKMKKRLKATPHEDLRIFRKKGKWAPIGPILAFYTCVTGKTMV